MSIGQVNEEQLEQRLGLVGDGEILESPGDFEARKRDTELSR